MSLERIRWIANELRLLLLEEDAGGRVVGNVAALDALGGAPTGDLRACASALLGDGDHGAELEAVLDSARCGVESAIAPKPGVRVLAMPAEPGRAAVLISALDSAVAESV